MSFGFVIRFAMYFYLEHYFFYFLDLWVIY